MRIYLENRTAVCLFTRSASRSTPFEAQMGLVFGNRLSCRLFLCVRKDTGPEKYYRSLMLDSYSYLEILSGTVMLMRICFASREGADKSLARPGRKQNNVSVRMALIFFGALPCKKIDDSSGFDVAEIVRDPDILSSLFPSWSD